MKTVFSILVLLFYGGVAVFLQRIVNVIPFAGLPGFWVGGKPGDRSIARFKFGAVVAAIIQTYVCLAYVAFIVAWTVLAARRPDVVGLLLWPVAILVGYLSLASGLATARLDAKGLGYASVQVEGFLYAFILSLIGFVVFALSLRLMTYLWAWVPYVSRLAQT
jgi:hypothetical protein